MNFSDQHLEEFIAMYQKRFGVVLTKQEALEKAIRLVRFMKSVLEGSQSDAPPEPVPISS